MSIENLLTPNDGTNKAAMNLNINDIDVAGNATVANTLTVTNLQVTGSSNLTSASARYNISPNNPGIIGGQLILTTDANDGIQNSIPFTTTVPQGIDDYIQPNGNFVMLPDTKTLKILVAGQYIVNFQMLVVSNATDAVIFQLLSNKSPYIVGMVSPILTSIAQYVPVSTIFPFLPYSNGCSMVSSANAQFDQDEELRVCYVTGTNGEVSLTSCLSINKIG